MERQGHFGDAALNYEQAAKNGGPALASRALFKLAKMRFRLKDYYEAHFNIRRAFQYDAFCNEKMKLYRTLIEGVVSLMKKKHKAGLALLKEIEAQVRNMRPDVRFVFHIFRAYGVAVHHQFEEALEDYKIAEKIQALDEAGEFDRTLCEGVIAVNSMEHEKALNAFSRASTIFPENKEPYIYRFLTYVSLYLVPGNAEEYVCLCDRAIDSRMLLSRRRRNWARRYRRRRRMRSCTTTEGSYTSPSTATPKASSPSQRYQPLHMTAYKAIKYADESIARHYFARGLCEACVNMFKEAIEDLDIVIRLDEKFTDAYLIKGKCAYLAGDANTAFLCYQQLIVLNKDDPTMHIHAGNLLMASGGFEDAGKAFENANAARETAIAHYQLAKVRLRNVYHWE
ncbi:MAG: hypothetical protein P4M11_14420 [Candidatus Pacebacteria bacterium]|nr:hypothetical protein [Candidatus Paceibacterota bacterium]